MGNITLRGRFLATGGAPQTGSVMAVLTVDRLTNRNTGAIIPRAVVTAVLDAAGGFAISVPATNDPAQTPQAALRIVEAMTGGLSRAYAVVVPYDAPGGVVELADLAERVPANLGYELVRYFDPVLLGQLIYPGFPNQAETVTTTFPADGTVHQAYGASGVSAVTTSNADGSLTTVYSAPLGRTLTVTFNSDGSITEVVT